MNRFVKFNHFRYSPLAYYKGELYNLPFNMNTFIKIWPDVKTPAEAAARIKEQRENAGVSNPRNLEEQAISLVGTDIYEKLIKGYTEKQWGRACSELPAFIIKRKHFWQRHRVVFGEPIVISEYTDRTLPGKKDMESLLKIFDERCKECQTVGER